MMSHPITTPTCGSNSVVLKQVSLLLMMILLQHLPLAVRSAAEGTEGDDKKDENDNSHQQ